ncbi:hypothetical protein [Coleofasciculus sp. E2-BRE-01]|uniref:hypothetical protein n=1 Tax=Coleofasciculus sp. E2-BRE-01 TaxID=3069524 RepID=UPI00406400D9
MGVGCRVSGVGFRVSGVGFRVSGVGCREKLTLRLRSASTPNFDRLNCRGVEVLNFTQRVTKIVYSLARLESACSLPYLILWVFVFL